MLKRFSDTPIKLFIFIFFASTIPLTFNACSGNGGGGGGSNTGPLTYSVGGSINGLFGTIVLQNNSGDDLSVSSNGSFSFSVGMADSETYNVTILTQPSRQTCSIASGTGSGAIAGSNVTSISMSCITNLTDVVTTFAGIAGTQGSADGVGTAAQFNSPNQITTDDTYLWVADDLNYTVRQIEISTANVTTIVGSAGVSGTTDGVGASARFSGLSGIVYLNGALYITEHSANVIRKVDLSTLEVSTFAGTAGASGSTDGVGAAARFNFPYSIATDGTDLYVAEFTDHTIRKIEVSTATVTTIAGTAGASGTTNGTGAAARFNNPGGIVYENGFLYIAEFSNNLIRALDLSDNSVTTLAGDGTSGGTDGTGTSASFAAPIGGLTVHNSILYVLPNDGHTIRAIDLNTAAVTTLAGSHGNDGFADGTGSAARFTGPFGVVFAAGYLFVSDTGSERIRRIE